MSKNKHIILPGGWGGKGLWMGEERKGDEDWEGLFRFEVEEIYFFNSFPFCSLLALNPSVEGTLEG